MGIPKFWIEHKDDEMMELFVGEKMVGKFNHNEHTWVGMKSMEQLFEATAKAVGAKFEKRGV